MTNECDTIAARVQIEKFQALVHHQQLDLAVF
jgi:hypothetical protein